ARRVGGVGEADPATAEEVEPVGLAATVVERQLVGGRAEAPGAGIEAKLQALAHEDAATAHDPYVADRDELLVVLVPGDAVAAHHRAGMPELGVALEGEVPVGTAARLVAAREDGPARFGRDGVARAQRGIHAQAQGARPGALRLRVREAGKHRRDERQDEAAGRRVGTTTRGKAGHAVRALAGGEGAATIDYYTKRPAMPGRPRARRRS